MSNIKDLSILMCGSDLSVGGGVVAISKNYLEYTDWNNINIKYIPTQINGGNVKKIIFFIKAYVKIVALLISQTVDIAHLHVCDGGPFYRKGIIAMTCHCFGVPVILHHHTDYTEFFGSLSGIKKRFIKHMLRKAEMNIVVGESLIPVITGIENRIKVIAIHNATTQYEKNFYNPNGKTILYIGWILERKGIYDLLNALQRIDKEIPDSYKLAICGDGSKEIKDKIKNMPISHRISHMGWVSKESLKIYYEDAIVNLLPSYREGLPMTILETMAYGIPNIASNISSIPEIIQHDRNGYLIEVSDIDKIAEYIKKIIFDNETRCRLSKAAYLTIINKFSIEEHNSKIEKVYKKIIEMK